LSGSQEPTTPSDGGQIKTLLELIIGVQHSVKPEGDVEEALNYLSDKVLGRTYAMQTVEFSTILEGSVQCAELYATGSDKVVFACLLFSVCMYGGGGQGSG
jgi:hypothetical protein